MSFWMRGGIRFMTRRRKMIKSVCNSVMYVIVLLAALGSFLVFTKLFEVYMGLALFFCTCVVAGWFIWLWEETFGSDDQD